MSPIGVVLGKQHTYTRPQVDELTKRDLALILRDLGEVAYPYRLQEWGRGRGQWKVRATKAQMIERIEEIQNASR